VKGPNGAYAGGSASIYAASINTGTGDASIFGAANGRAAYDTLGKISGAVAGKATGDIYTRQVTGVGVWNFCYTDPSSKKEYCNTGSQGNWQEVLPGINWGSGGAGSGSGNGGNGGQSPSGTKPTPTPTPKPKVTETSDASSSTVASAILAVAAGMFALVF
jgi:hypothetical protein